MFSAFTPPAFELTGNVKSPHRPWVESSDDRSACTRRAIFPTGHSLISHHALLFFVTHCGCGDGAHPFEMWVGITVPKAVIFNTCSFGTEIKRVYY